MKNFQGALAELKRHTLPDWHGGNGDPDTLGLLRPEKAFELLDMLIAMTAEKADGLRMGDDPLLWLEYVIREGMVPVVVGVDQMRDGAIGDPPDGVHHTPCQGFVHL